MIQPPSLQKGDTIGIPAPGKKISTEAIEASIKIIESWGFRIRVGRNVFSSAHSYLSGSDSERLADLQEMLDDDSINAILCARGGYGATRIVDQLNFTSFLKKPKWLCGFSDVTALHLKLQSLGIQSVHSSMPILFSKMGSALSIDSLRKILLGKVSDMEAQYHPANRTGKARGELVGGNLSLVVDSLGTGSEIITENKILVIEEIDEYLYKMDRMLVQLKRAGKLKHLAGLIVGHITDMKDTEPPFGEPIHDLIFNHVREYNFPIAINFPIGHENHNMAWIEGSVGELTVTKERSKLTF